MQLSAEMETLPEPTKTKKERMFAFLTEPHSSTKARIYSWYLDVLVGLSIFKFCCESVPSWSRTTVQRSLFFALESFVTAHLVVDFVLKLATQPTWQSYLGTWDVVIDGLSLVPWTVDMYRLRTLFSSDKSAGIKHYYSLRLLRLLRFIRFLRITLGNFPRMGLFLQAVRRSSLAILFLALYIVGAGLFFSGCLYYAETSVCTLNTETGVWMLAADPKSPCALQNMFHAIWLCMVTMATVGFGDIVPLTALGKAILVVIMITSMIVLPLPASIFGANLTELYLEERLAKRLDKRRPRGPDGPRETREMEVREGSRSLTRSRSPGPPARHLSSRHVHNVMHMMDTLEADAEQVSATISQANRRLLDLASRQRHFERMLLRQSEMR